MAAVLLVSGILVVPRSVDAQVGSRLGLGVDKGKVYGLDVRETPSIVFVVDFAIYEDPGYIEQVGDVATGDASGETQQDVAKKTGESVALALVPGGMLIRAGLNKHRDLAGQAESHIRNAIKGLDDDQQFGIVYLDSLRSRIWHEALVPADEENREAAENLIDDLYEGKGLLSAATMGISDHVVDDETEGRVPPTADQLLSAIEDAFALGPKTIVVIVAHSPANAGRLIDRVAALNADRRVVIHAAGFLEVEGPPSALRQMAEANGGVYLVVEDTSDDEEAESPEGA
jgi:hypothetical protein